MISRRNQILLGLVPFALGCLRIALLPVWRHPVGGVQLFADVAFGLVGLELLAAAVAAWMPATAWSKISLSPRLVFAGALAVFGVALSSGFTGYGGAMFNAVWAAILGALLVSCARMARNIERDAPDEDTSRER